MRVRPSYLLKGKYNCWVIIKCTILSGKNSRTVSDGDYM